VTTIGIFHENFAQNGGAERVVESMARLFPGADVLSTITVPSRLSPYMGRRGVRTTWMQGLPRLDRWFRYYVPLYPFAVLSSKTGGYGFVLSSCFGFAKGLRKSANAIHICYCHTPPRWIWRADDYSARERWGTLLRIPLKAFVSVARRWDILASRQPDIYIANSTAVAERLYCFYGRDSLVLHPPIELERFHVSDSVQSYYLVVSRLVPYKRIDLAIEACNRLGRKLKVIGDGPDRTRLEGMAGPTVEFLGRRPDSEVEDHFSQCRALLLPGEEDFGLTPLEANASGRPVIAYGVGGPVDTVIDGKTGIIFDEPSGESLAAGILRLEGIRWDSAVLRRHATNFGMEIFHERLKKTVVSVLSERGLTDVISEIERSVAS
jgi:glycosyltransferase involved in cell wall biosynthesis